MTVKEIRKFIFSGTPVRLVYNHETVFSGQANQLDECAYKDCHVKTDGICLGIKKPQDIIIVLASLGPKVSFPKEFDSYEIPDRLKDRMVLDKIPIHVTVLEDLVHHISGDRFYNIRIESKGLFNNHPTIKYRCVIEDEVIEMYNRGKDVN